VTTPAHSHDHAHDTRTSAETKSLRDALQVGEISIGMSGGGTRAAGYHLGMLSYLSHRGLLQDVAITASASGGSLVNSTYAMACARGWAFDQYYAWLYDKLRCAEMMKWVLAELSDGTPKNLSGRRSMVVALAEVYNRWFYGNFKFGELLDALDRAKDGTTAFHLKEVIINATDFRTGLGFRFQMHDPVGNGRTHIEPNQIRHVRLADVMAASSCLPGGLEPFYFPEDFVWEGDDAKRDAAAIGARLKSLNVEAVPLMDGGIYDNQGLESLMLAVARNNEVGEDAGWHLGTELVEQGDDSQRRLFEFDLLFQRMATGTAPKEPPGIVIISDAPLDADPVYRAGYEPYAKPPLPSLKPPPDAGARVGCLKTLYWLFSAAFALSILGTFVVARALPNDFRKDMLVVVSLGISVVLPLFAIGALYWLYVSIRDALGEVDDVLSTEGIQGKRDHNFRRTWLYLKRLRIKHLRYLIKIRVSSLVSLASDVFSIRTRVLSYMLVYMMPGWRDKLITNEIFDVAGPGGPDVPQPTEAMKKVVEHAGTMPTAFWFEHPEDLPDLIASGQMNMCSNLISHLRRRQRLHPEEFTPEMARLLDSCEQDWRRFMTDPHIMVSVPTEGQSKAVGGY
jgi:predicted acylesterase/phospholipase RssA